jgi:hypothetical protein
MEEPKILNSIDDAFRVLNEECQGCNEGVFCKGLGNYRINHDLLIHDCFLHDAPVMYTIGFKTSEQDVKKLEVEMQGFIQNLPPAKLLSYLELSEIFDKAGELISKAEFYADFALEDKVLKFNGFCKYCLQPREIAIKDRHIWISCPECASVAADSVD